MLRPTNDPLDVMRRAEADAARQTRQALAPGGTQNYQAVRNLKAALDEIRELVIRMPTNDGRQVDSTDWRARGAGWTTILSTSIPRPQDKSRVVVSANGFASGVAGDVLAFRSRILISGTSSPEFIGSAEGSAFITRSASYPSFVREIAPLTAASVMIQLQVTDAAAYDIDTRASLSVLAGFSTI